MKRLTALILTVLTVCSALPLAAFGGRFLDVPDGKWYSEGISFCAANGYMDGVAEGKFDRQSNLTRAMFMTILAKVDGADLSPYEGKSSFSDVKTDGWYTAAIEWAAQNDITGGIGDGADGKPIFGYKNAITREQMAQFFYVYSAYANEKNALPEITPMPEPPKEYAEGSVTAEEAYNAAIEAIAGIPDHRDVGELQSETQEMIMLEGEYYQSYVASTHDMRYIFIASAEYEMSPAWNWMPIGTRDDYSLDNLGNIDEDMRGDEPGFTPIDLTLRAELSVYTDGERTHSWAREAMEWAVAVGLISGKNDSLLDPRGNCTRAEAAVMIRAYVLGLLSDCEHDWVDATCTECGYCTKCELKKDTENGHDMTEGNCIWNVRCRACDHTEKGKIHANVGTPGCTEPAKCLDCGESVGSPAGHTPREWEWATCEYGVHCAVCGKLYIQAFGHTTDNGKCDRCGRLLFPTYHDRVLYFINEQGVGENGYAKILRYMTESDGYEYELIVYTLATEPAKFHSLLYAYDIENDIVFYATVEFGSDNAEYYNINAGAFDSEYRYYDVSGAIKPSEFDYEGNFMLYDFEGPEENRNVGISNTRNLLVSLLMMSDEQVEFWSVRSYGFSELFTD